MHLSLYQIANLVFIALLLVLVLRYLWMMMVHPPDQPASWKEAMRSGSIPRTLRKLERFYPDKVRFYTWWLQVERLKKESVPGAFAELGVYQGKSARILHLMDPSRRLYLFDTFEGFPAVDLKGEEGKASTYSSGHFADTSVSIVMKKLGGGDGILLFPGYFPETVKSVNEGSFSLVSLDADLYKPTKAGLEYFYPRLSPGGVILVHDYNPHWTGVIRAVDEFMKTIPETPVLIPDRDGTLLIIKGKKV